MILQQIDKYDQYIPYPQYLKLLLRATDGTTSGMKDFSGYGRAVTNSSDATGNTTYKNLNPYSMYFSGDDWVSVPDSNDWYFGSLDFTISAWFKQSSGSSSGCLVGQTDSVASTSACALKLSSGIIYANDVNLYPSGLSSGFTITDTYWHHAMVCRNGNIAYIYIDGILKNSVSVSGDATNVSSNLSVGRFGDYSSGFYYTGYIDEVAIWKGIAVPISQLYPQNKPFSFRRA